MVQILDELSEAVYVADIENYELLYTNGAAKKMFDIAPSSKTKCYEILHNRTSPCPVCSNAKLKDKEVYEWEFVDKKKQRHYLLKDKIINWNNNKKARMEIAMDVTNLRAKTKELDGMMNIESFIINCLKILHNKKSLNENINTILSETGIFLEANRTYIFDFDLKEQTMSNTYEWCSPKAEPQKDVLQDLPLDIIPNWFAAFNKDEYVYIPSVDDMPDKTTEEYKTLAMQNIKSLIAVPLQQEDGNLIGFIGVDDPSSLKSVSHIGFLFKTLSFFIVSMIEQQKSKQKLIHQSFTDSLTDLQNRNKFISDTEKIKTIDARKLGIAYIDLNDLKILNDNFGHKKGDEALVSVANKMLELFRRKDLYRVGGDEFVILCVGIPEDMFTNKMKELSDYSSDKKAPTFALGYKWFESITDLDQHLKDADALMYENKRLYHQQKRACDPCC